MAKDLMEYSVTMFSLFGALIMTAFVVGLVIMLISIVIEAFRAIRFYQKRKRKDQLHEQDCEAKEVLEGKG